MKALGSWSKTTWNAKLLTSSETPSKRKGTENPDIPCTDPWVLHKGVKFP